MTYPRGDQCHQSNAPVAAVDPIIERFLHYHWFVEHWRVLVVPNDAEYRTLTINLYLSRPSINLVFQGVSPVTRPRSSELW